MRKLALTMTCTTCVFSAFGVFARWLQNMTAFEENGLYIPGSLWGIVLTLLYIAGAAVFFGFTRYYKKNLSLACAPDPGVAFAGSGLLHKLIYLAVALIMACLLYTSTVEFFARARGIEAVYSGPEEPVRLTADRAMLETLLLNLLSNSLQHLGSGGRVEVSVSQLGSRVILSVDDNGEGMSSEQLARLFTGGASGAGLGLRLVRDIAQLHGGAFIIEGREGLGASARSCSPRTTPRAARFSAAQAQARGTAA